ncbi:ribosome maturation factor RimP [Aerophototrophica crusticola]|uniref:Ribosome maturation factor RimP n=1 Tax=Aerophototrophica crusticola TaxID=1709002 RepID=A0A858R331_9PROT|nr:ribosome maturation factor RimP [Rhodospirillaceae bacterium B3]
MDVVQRIGGMVGPSVEAMGYELVRLRLTGTERPVLQVMAERTDGRAMTVDDCAEISRTIATLLAVDDPIESAYTLEVSSPGIDRPLTRLKDFARFRGFDARIETSAPVDGRKRFRGLLEGTEGEDVLVRLEPKKKGEEVPVARVPFVLVAKAKLELTERLLEAAAAAQGLAAGTEGALMDVAPPAAAERPAKKGAKPKKDKPKRKTGLLQVGPDTPDDMDDNGAQGA